MEFFSLGAKTRTEILHKGAGRARIMLYAKGLCRCGKILRANPKARLLTTRRVQGSAEMWAPGCENFLGKLWLKW